VAKGSKWAKLRDQYPKLPLDAEYEQKVEAILNAPIPADDQVGADIITGDQPLRALPLNQVVAFYNLLREDIEELNNQLHALNAKLEACEFKISEHFEANDILTQKFEDGSSITVAPDPVVSVENESQFIGWVSADDARKAQFKLKLTVHPSTTKSEVKKLLEENAEVPPGVRVFYLNKLTRRSG